MAKLRNVWLGVVLVVLLAAAMGLLVGCGGDGEEDTGDTETTVEEETTESTEAPEEDTPEQVLRININTEPPSLDPNLATDTTSALVINNIFEGLVHIEPSGEPYPGAAESWDVSDDGLVYTFHLRGTDTWSNGDPVTSQDFKDSWLRILNPETAADYAYQLYFIEGAQDYNAGEGAAEDVAIETPDDTTLKVTLGDPAPWFVPLMSHQAYFPIHKATVEEFGDSWTEPENIVTNGAFTLEEWNHDSDLLLQKWTDWREADSVALETVEMPIITESTTGVAAFETGEIDVQMDLPTAEMERLKELPEYENFPLLGIYYYGFNTEHPPLDDVKVRKALALAMDRQAIIDNVAQADQLPATGITPKGMPGFDVFEQDYLGPTADVDKAKELLAEAGYPEGEGLPEITIYHNTSEGHQAIATAVQAQWTAIGANVTIKNMEWKQYLEFIQNNDEVMVYRLGWVADYADAYNFLDMFRGGGGNNFTRWANDEYDQGLADALKATDSEERWAIYKQMEDISTDEMPVAPIYWYTNPDLVAEYVSGYHPNPLGSLTNLWKVSIEAH